MDLQHPMIERIERTGHPYSDRRQEWGTDGLGNEVYTGDEILETEDDFFLVEELDEQSIEVLERVGAVYKTAI